MATRISSDYEQLGIDVSKYMTAPVRLGPAVRGKLTALGAGTGNPTSGIPVYMDPSESGVDYVADEFALRAKSSRPLPLSISEGKELSAFSPEADDTRAVLEAIQKDKDAMGSSSFSREIAVIPISGMSSTEVGTDIHVTDFSRADVFRPLSADAGLTGYKKPSGPGIRFVHFSDAHIDKPFAKV